MNQVAKKLASILLTAAMILSLGACNGASSNSGAGVGQQEGGAATGDANYPDKTITMIVPYAAGGGADILARAFCNILPRYLDNATIVIDNREGGNGSVGTAYVQQMPADGYTLGWYASAIFDTQPHITGSPFSIDDFTHIGTVVNRRTIICVGADAPYDTIDEMAAYVNANPGYTFGAPPAGFSYLSFVSLIKLYDLENTVFVPYSGGSSEALTALLGGHVDAIAGLPNEVMENIRAGLIKPIVFTGSERLSVLPDVPTLGEVGKDMQVSLTNGIVAPLGLDPDIREKLETAVRQTLEDPDFLEMIATTGDADFMEFHTGEETRQLLYAASEAVAEIVEELELTEK